MAVAGCDQLIHLFKTSNGEEVTALAGHTDDAQHCLFSPVDETRLVSVACSEMCVWDLPTSKCIHTAELGSFCQGVVWSPNGEVLCVVLYSGMHKPGKVRIVSTVDWTSVAEWALCEANGTGVAFSLDSTRCAVAEGAKVSVWATGTGVREQLVVPEGGESKLSTGEWEGAKNAEEEDSDEDVDIACVRSVAWIEEDALCSGDSVGHLRVWRGSPQLSLLQQIKIGDDIQNIQLVVQTEQSRRLLVASTMHVVLLHPDDRGKWEVVAKISGHSDGVRTAACHPSLPLACSASDDGTVRLWNLELAMELKPAPGHAEGITACTWCTAGFVTADGGK